MPRRNKNHPKRHAREAAFSPEIQSILALLRKPENRVEVSSILSNPLPLVKTTEAFGLEPSNSTFFGAYDATGLLRPDKKDHLAIRVTRSLLDRALRIMDAVLKTLESLGFAVSTDERRPRTQTLIAVSGCFVPIDIREMTTKPVESIDSGRADYRHHCLFLPTGRLIFGIGEIRDSWNDTATLRLEDLINHILIAIISQGEIYRIEKIEWEQARPAREEAERKMAERRALAEKASVEASRKLHLGYARWERFESATKKWSDCEPIRAFLSACEASLRARGLLAEGGPEARWIAWVRYHIDKMDPLKTNFLRDEVEAFKAQE